ncbi:MAG: hypothetical protein NTY88_11365 [Bacteroidetes bacterium]|nr:hypothetical protein [Bacteroidota bacterium]
MIIPKDKGLHLISESRYGDVQTYDLHLPITKEEFIAGLWGKMPYSDGSSFYRVDTKRRILCIRNRLKIDNEEISKTRFYSWGNSRTYDEYPIESKIPKDKEFICFFIKNFHEIKNLHPRDILYGLKPFYSVGEKGMEFESIFTRYSDLEDIVDEQYALVIDADKDRYGNIMVEGNFFCSMPQVDPRPNLFSPRFYLGLSKSHLCAMDTANFKLHIKPHAHSRDYIYAQFVVFSEDKFVLCYHEASEFKIEIISIAEVFPDFAATTVYKDLVNNNQLHRQVFFKYLDRCNERSSEEGGYHSPTDSPFYNDDLDMDQQSPEFWDDIT